MSLESTNGTELKIRLRRREEGRIQAGHSWIFSNEIAEVGGKFESGDLGEVFSSSGEFLGVGFYNPHSLIAVRILSRERLATADSDFFYRRLSAALSYREKNYPGRAPFYRLCFGESDELPGLVVDRYDRVLVLQVLSAGMEKRLPQITEALLKLLNPSGIYLKNNHRSRALEGLNLEEKIHYGEIPPLIQVDDFGLKFSTPISSAQKTGFYFDQSENRVFLRPHFPGKTVFDFYSYTGSFGINAAKFGAKSVLGFDSSGDAVSLANQNASLNGVSSIARFEKKDAEEALVSLAEKGDASKPDMILLDPPSLVPSRKDLPKAERLYVRLNSLALRALPAGGLLAASTCSHHVGRELFISILRQAAGKAKKSVRLLSLRTQALDHPVLLAMPETEYLHFALVEIVG